MKITTTSNEIIDIINKLSTDIQGIYLFGSYSIDNQSINSDIDILVKTNSAIMEKEQLLCKLIPGYIDLFFFKEDLSIINPISRFQIKEDSESALWNRLKPIQLWNNIIYKTAINRTFKISDLSKVKLTGP
ncbi:nucleotidyltransferase domain-containing protein [Algoriphagus sp. Y33]|uniref:nucleotidyltransferase domain-containing protein n=1 Tax=Algoriphagus sp. Y33 TaxID=2772483 RepID=UPI00177BCCF6|nr:nucleotidyltransferase domain-containing protein [Algoriphagus sp. Y33]